MDEHSIYSLKDAKENGLELKKTYPAKPELYGPYDSCWLSISPNDLQKRATYVFGAHTPHGEADYGVRYQFDWGDGQRESCDFGWPDPGMPNPSHSWVSAGEKLVRVRARYYDPDHADNCSKWSAWNIVKVTVKE